MNKSTEELLALIEGGLPDGYGYPSRRRRRRMSVRQLKKHHLPPFACLVGDVRVTLSRKWTRDDASLFPFDDSYPEHDQVFVELMIDAAEATDCGVVVGCPLREGEACLLEAMHARTVREELKAFERFAKAVLQLPAVTEVRIDIQDGWHLSCEDECHTFATLVFQPNATAQP